jgi:hypothetical protein
MLAFAPSVNSSEATWPGQRTAASPGLRRLEWAAAGLLGVATLWVHGLRLAHAGSLWRDESGALSLATRTTLREVFRLFPHEAFPLAVPMTIRLYTRIAGEGDQALRWLGMAIGLAIAGALWLSARVTGRTLPLLSLALIAGNASFTVFGDSLRGYGLGSLCILLAFISLARLLARPGWWSAAAALLAVLASVHCLLSNLALAEALCAAAFVTALRRGSRRLALALLGIGVAAALSLLPYWSPLSQARGWSVAAAESTNLERITSGLGAAMGPARLIWPVLALGALAGAARFGPRRNGGPPAAAPQRAPHDAPDGGRVQIEAAHAAAARARRDEDMRRFAVLAIVLASAAEALFLATLGYHSRAWYYLPLLVLIAAALEPLLAELCRAGWAARSRVVLAVVLTFALLACELPRLRERMTNVDLVAGRLAAAAGDDLVLVSPWYFGVSFDRYYRGPAGWTTVPALADHRIHRYDQLKARLAAPQPIADVLERVRRALGGGHRVWLVGRLRLPPAGEAPPHLPPAPATRTGWQDTPYIDSWSLQLGAFLRDHAAALETIPVPCPDPVSSREDMSLAVARGWR